jgi:hypothetical protein
MPRKPLRAKSLNKRGLFCAVSNQLSWQFTLRTGARVKPDCGQFAQLESRRFSGRSASKRWRLARPKHRAAMPVRRVVAATGQGRINARSRVGRVQPSGAASGGSSQAPGGLTGSSPASALNHIHGAPETSCHSEHADGPAASARTRIARPLRRSRRHHPRGLHGHARDRLAESIRRKSGIHFSV